MAVKPLTSCLGFCNVQREWLAEVPLFNENENDDDEDDDNSRSKRKNNMHNNSNYNDK